MLENVSFTIVATLCSEALNDEWRRGTESGRKR